MGALVAVPLTPNAAHVFVAMHHRHHRGLPPWQSNMQDLFAVGVACDGALRGVAVVSRPFARHMDDGETAEVSRCCTDGARNACSFLYGRAARAAKELGYRRIVTYILHDEETGASLKASGWVLTSAQTDKRGTRRHGATDGKAKARWERRLSEGVGGVREMLPGRAAPPPSPQLLLLGA